MGLLNYLGNRTPTNPKYKGIITLQATDPFFLNKEIAKKIAQGYQMQGSTYTAQDNYRGAKPKFYATMVYVGFAEDEQKDEPQSVDKDQEIARLKAELSEKDLEIDRLKAKLK